MTVGRPVVAASLVLATACGGSPEAPTGRAPARIFAYAGAFAEAGGGRQIGANSITAYAVDTEVGAWTAVASIPGYGSLAIDADGRFLFVGHWGVRRSIGGSSQRVATLSSYAIDSASGVPAPAAEIDLGNMDETLLFVHPTRAFLYVADQSFDGVRVFSTAVAGGPAPVSTGVTAATRTVATDPMGRFVYLTSSFERDPERTILGYAVDRANGGLRPLGPVATGVRLTVAPSGRFAYVARSLSGTVTAHSLDGASGQLSSIATVAAKDASRVAVDPSGRFLFACGDDSWPGVIPRLPGPAGGVLEFRLDSTTGQPTALGRVGDEPCDFLAPDPSGRFLYVSRARSADVFAYRIDDSTGSLAPLGTVRNERAGWIGFAAFDR